MEESESLKKFLKVFKSLKKVLKSWIGYWRKVKVLKSFKKSDKLLEESESLKRFLKVLKSL